MPLYLTEKEYSVLEAVCDRLIPGGEDAGAVEAGCVDYIDTLLSAFMFDPPRIWAEGPYSGRRGGDARFSRFLPLAPIEELAWRIRIEGSLGIPEREFNGPVVGLQQRYRQGIASLGDDFATAGIAEQDSRLRLHDEFLGLVYEHCCEGMYGSPEYGGNRNLAGWLSIDFPGDVQPRGYSDLEVSGP